MLDSAPSRELVRTDDAPNSGILEGARSVSEPALDPAELALDPKELAREGLPVVSTLGCFEVGIIAGDDFSVVIIAGDDCFRFGTLGFT